MTEAEHGSMRWLVVGAGGMLGCRLRADLIADGASVHGLDRAALDVTDARAVAEVVGDLHPDVVVNASAYTAVDAAETDEVTATAVNADGPANLATACVAGRITLLHLSTDYVFAGDAGAPYDEDAPRDPVGAYGRSKAEGERRVLAVMPHRAAVVRTAWLYGPFGSNFATTMLRLERERDTVDVVTDQRGQPTSTAQVSAALRRLAPLVADGRAAGTFHATCSGETTWFDFARSVFGLAGADPGRVHPTDSASFVRPAPRPAYSVLGHRRWAEHGLPVPAPWQEALSEAFPSLSAP